MKNLIKRIHLLNHLFVPISVGAIILSFVFRSSPVIQFGILMSVLLLYVSLALIHHTRSKNLTIVTMLEYILIATLAIVILTGVIL
ncbi:MAG: hypothetical protein ACD_31C00007G0003 [uncultured bacterium]|uniref:Uncharacterized protein n=3 Tax=Candidatus Daviesiibacteriota TaxID=1752718 RepID=A0A0G0ERU9_9BACT|nr:MAG: hypothetical protein ACD_31C00007G0003 [uncultured bacterium]KKQ09588.1 MAG: hypothetical protein US19_C0012G0022 [Candidatus Daviesbacteria bacterium GW2011_GWB1_36_5]KKQ16436.1 MAG: hypothetical protein US28_C0001G0026 [Candidatus Daviesbacteria bacterium GW2011_GWA1_36_8]OGE17769.1 MAG: hypothetical protein A2858_03425 [Candidatus Daviesbacteria bacterium RIFCSPHIGHO2_01_FULL_36_37]